MQWFIISIPMVKNGWRAFSCTKDGLHSILKPFKLIKERPTSKKVNSYRNFLWILYLKNSKIWPKIRQNILEFLIRDLFRPIRKNYFSRTKFEVEGWLAAENDGAHPMNILRHYLAFYRK